MVGVCLFAIAEELLLMFALLVETKAGGRAECRRLWRVDGVAEEDGFGKVNEERGDRDGDDEGGEHG